MQRDMIAERLAAAEGELRSLREDIEAGATPQGDTQVFADAQIRMFGSWVLDLLGFEGDDAFDKVGEARSLLVPLIAKGRPREDVSSTDNDAEDGFVDIFADDED